MHRTLTPVSLSVIVIIAFGGARAADVVRIAPAKGEGAAFGIEGQILDYTGREIVIRPDRGTERRFPADRVVEIQTAWPSGYEEGLRALASGDFAAAQEHFIAANRAESRTWARRLALAGLAEAMLGLVRTDQAGEVVLAILASDPTSPHLDLLPLAWSGDAEVPPQKAQAWLAQPDFPAANLLGASYLLSTAKQMDAAEALRRLTAVSDARIAALAEAQLWRTRIATADAAEVERWQTAIERMPTELRAGPYFVVGEAWRRLGRQDEAALALLRVPVHAPEKSGLAARALLAAAESLRDAGHSDEALRIAREILRDHAETPSAKTAKELVRMLQP
jgi:tetratricopeptide (TPR) repeat protein